MAFMQSAFNFLPLNNICYNQVRTFLNRDVNSPPLPLEAAIGMQKESNMADTKNWKCVCVCV